MLYLISCIVGGYISCIRVLLVQSTLKFYPYRKTVLGKVSSIANSILRGTVCRSPSFIIQVLNSYISSIIDLSNILWNTGYNSDLHLLESIQRRWTKATDRFNRISNSDGLKRLNMFSIMSMLIYTDLILI